MIAPRAFIISDPAGYGKYIPVIPIRHFRGDHASAFNSSFNDHGSIGQPANDPVPYREVMFIRAGVTRELREYPPAFPDHFFGKPCITGRINSIQSMANNTYSGYIIF